MRTNQPIKTNQANKTEQLQQDLFLQTICEDFFSSARRTFLLGSFCPAPSKSFRLAWCWGLFCFSQSLHHIASHKFSPFAVNISICYDLYELLDLIFKPRPGCGIPARQKVFVLPKHENFSMILRPDSVTGHSWWLEPSRPSLGTTSWRITARWSNHLEFLRAQILSTGNPILFSLCWGAPFLPPPAWSLNPALRACSSSNSWNAVNEYLFIQGSFQGGRVTLFLFKNCAWVFPRILRNAFCKRLKPLLTPLSSLFWCSVQ